MTMKKYLSIMALGTLVAMFSGCTTVGYSYAKDPNIVRKWDATIITVEKQNIHNSNGAFWVGALAKVEAVGLKVTLVTDDGQRVTEVQPQNKNYTLTAGEHVIYIVDYGRVWAQPVNYPLPPDFNTASPPRLGIGTLHTSPSRRVKP